MYRGISISRYRGLAQAELKGFRSLNILVGPNACGKSSVLEALYISASQFPASPLEFGRLSSKSEPFRWWFYQGKSELGLEIHLKLEPSENHDGRVTFECGRGVYSDKVLIKIGSPRGTHQEEFSFEDLQRFATEHQRSRSGRVRFVDVKLERVSLPVLYTEAIRAGFKRAIVELVKVLIPEATGIEILTSSDGDPELNVNFADSAIPVALMGDGITSAIRQCLEVACPPGSVVLIEEPEAFKHPASVVRVAEALVAASKRGTQVFLTTHSLELIDALLEFSADHLQEVAVFRMRLAQGQLYSSRFSGQEASELRAAIQEDLR